MDFHSSPAWVHRFADVIYPENQAPVVFTDYRLIALTRE